LWTWPGHGPRVPLEPSCLPDRIVSLACPTSFSVTTLSPRDPFGEIFSGSVDCLNLTFFSGGTVTPCVVRFPLTTRLPLLPVLVLCWDSDFPFPCCVVPVERVLGLFRVCNFDLLVRFFCDGPSLCLFSSDFFSFPLLADLPPPLSLFPHHPRFFFFCSGGPRLC